MAISVVQLFREVPGAKYLVIAEVSLDTSYPTGGYSFAPATFGLNSLDFAIPVSTSGAYMASLDQAGKKIKIFQNAAAAGAFAEVPNATNVSSVKVYVLVKGR